MNLTAMMRALLVCSLWLAACAREDAATPLPQGSGGAPLQNAGAGGSGGAQVATGGAGGIVQASGGSASVEEDAGSVVSAPLDASMPVDAATDPADAASAIDASDEPHPSFVGCRGPEEPGCVECTDGPGSFRSGSPGFDAYNSSSINASCEPDCPVCASCTYWEERAADHLEMRDDCLPCPDDLGFDACFERNSCECWCTNYKVLHAACPTLVP